MDEWLEQAGAKLAERTGEAPGEYELSQGDVEELLELARLAARRSGERMNAPLVCYLVGLARGRRDVPLADLVDSLVGS